MPRRTITADLGISDKLLTELLGNEPVHARNQRPRAKDDLRQLAVEMRLAGRTYDDIALELGTSKGTLSLWLRDKRHNARTSRKNVDESYRGCLVIRLVKCRELYQRIDGTWRGLVSGLAGWGR